MRAYRLHCRSLIFCKAYAKTTIGNFYIREKGKALDIDSRILKKAIAGDMDAFEHIVKKYEKLVYNIAYKMFRNPEDAKDISQEVFIKIFKNISKCSDTKTLKSWICTITSNTCIDELRKRKGKNILSLEQTIETDEGEIPVQLARSDETPEDVLLLTEKQLEIKNALDRLPEQYKLLIVLRDMEGLSYNELADVTNANLGTIKSRLSRARLMAKDILIKEQKRPKSV